MTDGAGAGGYIEGTGAALSLEMTLTAPVRADPKVRVRVETISLLSGISSVQSPAPGIQSTIAPAFAVITRPSP